METVKTVANIHGMKKGGFIILEDSPCRIDRVTFSSSGKHGHAKVRVEATGLLDGKHRNIVKPSGDMMDVPIILKKKAQILAIQGENAQLMDMDTYEVFELPVPEELKGQIQGGQEIVYFEIVGQRTLKQVK